IFQRSIRRAGNLHLKERANVPKECAKTGTTRHNLAHYFRIHLK
ncbi:general secretion pathway protein A, partial [Geobacillus sp. PK12]